MAGIQPGVHIPLLSPLPSILPRSPLQGWMGVRCSLGGKREGERGRGGGCGWGKGALKASRGGGGGGGEMYLRQFSLFFLLFSSRGAKRKMLLSRSLRDIYVRGGERVKRNSHALSPPFFFRNRMSPFPPFYFAFSFFRRKLSFPTLPHAGRRPGGKIKNTPITLVPPKSREGPPK